MEEIGLKLKTKREENGVSLDEAANDLKIRKTLLEYIEEGNKDAFKDVLTLKLYIRDYAKYLGLDGEKILDEFNEYLFEQTSKISIEDIETAKKEKEEKEKEMKILSPYTITKKDKKRKYIIMAFLLILIIAITLMYLTNTKNKNDDFVSTNEIGGSINEYSK